MGKTVVRILREKETQSSLLVPSRQNFWIAISHSQNANRWTYIAIQILINYKHYCMSYLTSMNIYICTSKWLIFYITGKSRIHRHFFNQLRLEINFYKFSAKVFISSLKLRRATILQISSDFSYASFSTRSSDCLSVVIPKHIDLATWT